MEYNFSYGREELLCRMEQIIAKSCSNRNYSIGNYRYPVHYWKNGKTYHTTGNGPANIKDTEVIGSMYYQFGVHRLDIGEALLEIVDLLEYICPELYEAIEDYDEDQYERFTFSRSNY